MTKCRGLWHLVITLAAVGSISLVACGAQQEPTGPQAVLEAFIEARNAADMDAALSFVADDAVFDTAFGDYSGKGEIIEYLQDMFDALHQTELLDVEVNGDVVTATEDASAAHGDIPDLECEAVVQDGKIISYSQHFLAN